MIMTHASLELIKDETTHPDPIHKDLKIETQSKTGPSPTFTPEKLVSATPSKTRSPQFPIKVKSPLQV